MFYFFQKADQFLRCEMSSTDDGWIDLHVHEPGCRERLERFSNYEDAEKRWDELRVRFNVDGWAGPFGRE